MRNRLARNITKLLVIMVLSFQLFIPNTVFSYGIQGGGPIILMGIDAEDGGVGGHGPNHVYQSVVKGILAKVTNGNSGIVVIGANGNDPKEFWDEISKAINVPVVYITGVSKIRNLDLTNFAMMAVSTDDTNLYGGLTKIEHDALADRKDDIAAFVNNGGGLLGFASNFANPYAYLGSIGDFKANTTNHYSDISATSDGAKLGITNELDVHYWHDSYESYPTFLNVLAKYPNGKVAALGGQVAVPATLDITPDYVSLPKDEEIQLNVQYDKDIKDNVSPVDVTDQVTYKSSSPLIIVSEEGELSAAPEAQLGDEAVVTAIYKGTKATTKVTIRPKIELIDIKIPSATISLQQGQSYQLAVSGVYSDNSEKDITYATAGTTYSSNSSNLATVSPNGLISIPHSAKPGEMAVITVKNQNREITFDVKVERSVVTDIVKIEAKPDMIDIKPGESYPIYAIAMFNNSSTKDITKDAKYSSNSSAVSVSKDGVVTANRKAFVNRSYTVTVSYGSAKALVKVNIVPPPPPPPIEVTPNQIDLEPGDSESLQVFVKHDGDKKDVTKEATYSSSSSAVSVSKDGIVTANLKAVANQPYTITVSYEGSKAQVKVNILPPPPPPPIEVYKKEIDLEPGGSEFLQVFEKLTMIDVTKEATYSSSSSMVSVSKDGEVKVNPKAFANRSYTVTVSYKGSTEQVRVNIVPPPPPPTLEVTANEIELEPGDSESLNVIVRYSDGSTDNVTTEATYVSKSSAVIVSKDGVVTVNPKAFLGRTYTITVSYKGSTKEVKIHVAKVIPGGGVLDLQAIPNSLVLKKGESQMLQVIANLKDGVTLDVTDLVTYTSSSNAILVSLDGKVTVNPRAFTGKTHTITISYGGKQTQVFVSIE